MEFMEEAYVELNDGRRGLIVEVRLDGHTRYDVELPSGELTTVYHAEVDREVLLPVH